MSPEIVGILGIVLMLALMTTGMWIGFSMGVVGFLGVWYLRGFDQALNMSGAIPYQNIAFYPISVLPMFVFMGLIVAQSGIGSDLYFAAHKFIGFVRGGLASASVIACAMLAAITGTTTTGIIVMAKVALPEMRKYKYDEGMAVGSIASSATMGILIPPSVAFVMYGILTEQSIGTLFIAGIIPGILQCIFYIIVIYILCRINPKFGPAGPRTTFKEKMGSLKNVWAMVALFVLVIGGIYGGIFTPTEAGAVGAFGSLIISLIMRRLSMKGFMESLTDTVVMTGMILFMLAGTFIFMYFMALSRVPFAVGDWVVALNVPPWVVVAAIIVMYVILGGPLPELPLVMLTIPILFPVIQRLGLSPIWFGVIIVRMLEIGSISPPVGQNIFVMSGMTGVPISTVYRGVMPFIYADVVHVALLVAIVPLSTWLPGLMVAH
jgi:C4-dicarboxylate transporter, DctM subunit